jgi:phage baseplate assembly protein V
MNILTLISNKIYSMIGRAILTAVSNSGKVQRIQIKGVYDETLTDIDRIQEYGLETYPEVSKDTEVIIVCPDGNREQAIAITIGTRAGRPTDLNEGEVKLYSKFGNKILLDKDGKIMMNGTGKKFVTHSELNTALQNFMTALNLHTHPTAAVGPPSPPTVGMSLDISSAATTTLETGG